MGRPKTWDRSEVLRRATRLFWEKGFEGTHLQELVRVAGINRFALYKEFGGKEGLFEESLRNYMKDMEVLTSLLAREPLGLANIRAMFRATDAYDFHHGCFVLNTVREKHVVGAGAWSATRKFVEGGEAAFRRNVEAAVVRGELPPATDAEGLARFLVALDIGLITYGVAAPEGTDRGRALEVLDRFLDGLSGGRR
ncbi:MAG: TetR/AcrR family transcriptional regulator [Planctomycetes bacterium]|nr:TetR/AcrR family transcriptional regulator [Planctomycetota bacterium]